MCFEVVFRDDMRYFVRNIRSDPDATSARVVYDQVAATRTNQDGRELVRIVLREVVQRFGGSFNVED